VQRPEGKVSHMNVSTSGGMTVEYTPQHNCIVKMEKWPRNSHRGPGADLDSSATTDPHPK